MVDESEGPTEGTDATVEPGLEDGELDNAVSEFHRARGETTVVIDKEEAVRTLVTWKDARKKTLRQQDRTEISVHVRQRQVRKNLEQITKMTRYFRCKRLGHFSRDCLDKARNKPAAQVLALVLVT